MDTHEASLYTAVLITAMVLGCIIIYFAISVYAQQRKHIRMQREYFFSEVNLLEKERYRVARDLHDELGPSLSMVRNHLDKLEPTGEKDHRHITMASQNLLDVMQRMGQIAINLAPSALERKGLKAAIEDFLDTLSEGSTIHFELIYDVRSGIDKSVGIHLFRIVQELCHNAVKHANAENVWIKLKERSKKIYLYYKDNGVGFQEATQANKGKGMGLGSLKSRTELLGGKMNFQSSGQKGTIYFFEFPIPPKTVV